MLLYGTYGWKLAPFAQVNLTRWASGFRKDRQNHHRSILAASWVKWVSDCIPSTARNRDLFLRNQSDRTFGSCWMASRSETKACGAIGESGFATVLSSHWPTKPITAPYGPYETQEFFVHSKHLPKTPQTSNFLRLRLEDSLEIGEVYWINMN